MEMMKLLFLMLSAVCLCSCIATGQPSPNVIVNISNISTLFDGGSTRAKLTFHDGSIWTLFYNRSLSDKDQDIDSYQSLMITQIEPASSETVKLQKGGKQEAEWLCLLANFQANHPQADKDIIAWVDRVLKEKDYSEKRGVSNNDEPSGNNDGGCANE